MVQLDQEPGLARRAGQVDGARARSAMAGRKSSTSNTRSKETNAVMTSMRALVRLVRGP